MNLPEKIKIVSAHFECRMCPTIVIGTTVNGSTIYARYRWGRLVIRLDHGNPPTLGGAAGAWILDVQLDPAGLDGCMSYDEIREITGELVEWPENPTQNTHDDSEATTWPDDYEG